MVMLNFKYPPTPKFLWFLTVFLLSPIADVLASDPIESHSNTHQRLEEIKSLSLSYPDSARRLLLLLRKEASSQTPFLEASITQVEGVIHVYSKEYEASIDKFQQSFDMFDEVADVLINKGDTVSLTYYKARSRQAQCKNNIGACHYMLSRSTLAIEGYLEALALHEELSKSPIKAISTAAQEDLATTTDNIGRIYKTFEQHEKALHYSLKALEMLKRLDSRSSLGCMLNISYSYKALEKNDSCMYYAQKTRALADPKEEAYEYHAAGSVIAEIYAETGQHKKALPILREIVQFREENISGRRLHNFDDLLQEVLLEMGLYSEAEERAFKVLDLTFKTDDPQQVLASYRFLKVLYQTWAENTNDPLYYKKSNTYLTKYYTLKDSVQSIDRYKEFGELQTKYESQKNERDNLILQQENLEKASLIEKQQLWVLSLGVVGGLLVVLLFISYRFYLQRKNAARKLAEDKDTIERQARKLKSLDAFKSRFFANVSHDLRTPLTLMMGHISEIKKGDNYLNVKSQESLDKLETNTNKLTHLTDEIRDLILLEDEKLTLSYGKVEMVSYLGTLVELFSSAADMKHITLTFTSPKHKALMMHVDTLQFEKIIYNLISNALKFTARDGDIKVSLNSEQGRATLIVEDNGAGISADKVDYIFNRFYQASDNPHATEEGIGIGLALVLELVELHGGSINVDSTQGKGTRFTVELPFNLDKQVTVESNDEPGYVASKKDLLITEDIDPLLFVDLQEDKKRAAGDSVVLIVDDHPDIRNYITELIQDEYIIRQAGNGEQALEVLGKEKVDIVITDLMMPWMDGYGLIHEMKQHEVLRLVPILVVSARTTEEDKIKVLEKGVNDVLAKPFLPEELKLRINNAISRKSSNHNVWDALAEDKKRLNDMEKDLLARVNTLILSRIDDGSLSVQHIADELLSSNRNAYNLVNKLTGMSPKEYISYVKFQYAMDLMKKQKVRSVTEAAQAIGMSNPTHFGKQFKRKMGVHPVELLV